uniref:Uncharacterized protein n=1 Tax=Sphaerodactylus townsendi TaxID=933632 RepID=A0ACB8ET65_9SAUR
MPHQKLCWGKKEGEVAAPGKSPSLSTPEFWNSERDELCEPERRLQKPKGSGAQAKCPVDRRAPLTCSRGRSQQARGKQQEQEKLEACGQQEVERKACGGASPVRQSTKVTGPGRHDGKFLGTGCPGSSKYEHGHSDGEAASSTSGQLIACRLAGQNHFRNSCFPSVLMWPVAPGTVWTAAICMADMDLGEVLEQAIIEGVQEQDEVQAATDTFMARSGQLMSRICPATMGPPRCGVYWQAEVVTILLRTVRDRGYATLLMASTGLTKRRAFWAVARALQEAGFHRKEVQACTKWKALKRDFFAAMEASGGHPRRSSWPPHFAALRQLWRLAGQPHWADRRPEGATARWRALALLREPLDEPVEGRGGDSSSDETSIAAPEERGEAAEPQRSSSSSSMEGAVEQPPAHSVAAPEAGPSDMAGLQQSSLQPHCDCYRLLARIERQLLHMERRLAALERRPVAEGHPRQTTAEPPVVLSSGTASATQQPASSSSSPPQLQVDLQTSVTLAGIPTSPAPGAPPEAPLWGGPAPHLVCLPSSSEDTP